MPKHEVLGDAVSSDKPVNLGNAPATPAPMKPSDPNPHSSPSSNPPPVQPPKK